MSYFDEGGTLPPPFNIIPSPKSILYLLVWLHNKLCQRGQPPGEASHKCENLREFTVSEGRTTRRAIFEIDATGCVQDISVDF